MVSAERGYDMFRFVSQDVEEEERETFVHFR
jgi:hypothetical protein